MPTDAPAPAAHAASVSQVRRSSLTTRVVLVTTTVALLAVLLTGLAALPLLREAELRDQRRQLSQLADAAAASTLQQGPFTDDIQRRLVETLRREQVSIAVVNAASGLPPGYTAADVAPLWTTGRLSSTLEVDDETEMVEGRLLTTDTGLLLSQPTSVSGFGLRELWGRIGTAIVIGGVLAAVAGAVLARRVTRSLRLAAQAADQLQAGERDVRLEPEGPAEVADLAVALNRLGDSLASSEARQRDFLLSVSHELRTPMTAINGYAEALADGVVAPADVPRVTQTMQAESARLDALIADLLDLARIGAVEFPLDVATIDLREVGEQAAAVWGDRCRAVGVQWRTAFDSQPVTAITDGRRVRQIIDNLVANALRVTPADAPIVLSIRHTPDRAIVEVRDGGPGLSDDDLVVAFEPAELYSRYRAVRQVGTGVGLALVGRLAQRLGGTAAAGHAPEGGACFRVSLPAAANSA